METKELEYDKFSEELYFLLMSSQLKERIEKLGSKHGLCGKGLRDRIVSQGAQMVKRIEIPMHEECYPVRQTHSKYQN